MRDWDRMQLALGIIQVSFVLDNLCACVFMFYLCMYLIYVLLDLYPTFPCKSKLKVAYKVKTN